ncbi:hypothetical protein [Streptomyces thermolilacinus]|nr:hypothetical protein [Streptomyces thermolilacinus]
MALILVKGDQVIVAHGPDGIRVAPPAGHTAGVFSDRAVLSIG